MKRVTFYGHEKNETTARLAQISSPGKPSTQSDRLLQHNPTLCELNSDVA